MGRPTKFTRKTEAEWAALLATCADEGLAITGASKRLGINTATFASWERLYPAFKDAAIGVRRNSEKIMLSRTEKQLGRSVEKLEKQLAWAKAQRAAEKARVDQAIAEGKLPSPERLKDLIQAIKEKRREDRQRERAATKARFRGGISVTTVQYDPTTKQ
jgi:hypothetical protein